MTTNEIIAELRRRRLELGLSQSDVARRSGMRQPMISRLETGARDGAGFATLRRYARAVGIDLGLITERNRGR